MLRRRALRILIHSFRPRQFLERTPHNMSTRKMESNQIIRSQNDKREYRLIRLENGLQALLISDLDGCDQSAMEEETQSGTESEEESGSSSGSEYDSDQNMEDMEPDTQHKQTGEKKSAAALCVGIGSFSDPDDIPGFAHFLEHMVFMGSEKYPDENSFDDYLGRHGGESNAWTDHEKTCFYFDIERNYFQKALDRWSQFFVAPLLLQDSVDREIEAVDSEFQESLPSDLDRSNHLMASMAKKGNPMSKFLLGNADTLKKLPAEKGIDVYGRLRDFFNFNYTAQHMTLAVHSKHNLDTLEGWVRESFSDIHNNGESLPSFSQHKEPFDTGDFRKIYKVIPVESTHKVILTWAFPPLQHQYRVKPLEYLSLLMAHEGEGSIFSLLKQRTWALELTGGNSEEGYDMNSVWSGFTISVTLTDEGLKNVNEVVGVIFQYIRLMRKEGSQEWFYKEQQAIEETKFRWIEQGDPTDYVEKVCHNMQIYPPEAYLTGSKLLYKYDHKVIEDCIDHLRADNCNVMIMSTNFTEKECNKKEHWFGTQYSVEDISSDLLASWNNAKESSQLFLPKPNLYIATDFSLKEVPTEELSFVPKLVATSQKNKLFFKKDTKFNVPKGYVFMHLKSPVVCASLKNNVMFCLLTAIMNQNISEPTYPAILAGYEIGVSLGEEQAEIVIEVDGFNHKLPEVLNLVVELLVNFSCSDELFEAMKTHLKKTIHNELIKPYDAARMVRFTLIEKRYWPIIDKYRVVDSLTKEDLLNTVQKFLQQVFVVGLVIGNFKQKEAVSIFKGVRSSLNSREQIDDAQLMNNVLELPRQKTYCQVRGFNPEDSNSCVMNYYQSSPGNLLKSCLNQLLVTRMAEPCFNTLRTKHQLGYSVFCTNHQTCGIVALGICVECQAHKFSMGYVDEQIEAFLLEMRDILQAMTQEEFDNLIESLITLKKVEDTLLAQEAERHWREIKDQTYLFDREQHEINVLKKLSLKSLQDWFTEEYLGDNQRKLSVQIIGTQESGTSLSSGGTDKLHNYKDHYIKCLKDLEQTNKVAVENIQDFKQSLKCLPHTKIVS